VTQGIERMLNLPSLEDILREKGVLPEGESVEPVNDTEIPNMLPENEELMRTVEMAKQAQSRLDMVEGIDHSEAMDKLHKETLKHAQDLMDLGFNIDQRSARGIFEVAVNMYGRAIEAKNAKRDAQLKSLKLALEQRKLELDEKRINAQIGEQDRNTIPGEGVVIREDRNELIKRIREQRENEQKEKKVTDRDQ